MLPGPADLETRNTHEPLTLRSAKKDLDSASTLFPFLEKTKIKLVSPLPLHHRCNTGYIRSYICDPEPAARHNKEHCRAGVTGFPIRLITLEQTL